MLALIICMFPFSLFNTEPPAGSTELTLKIFWKIITFKCTGEKYSWWVCTSKCFIDFINSNTINETENVNVKMYYVVKCIFWQLRMIRSNWNVDKKTSLRAEKLKRQWGGGRICSEGSWKAREGLLSTHRKSVRTRDEDFSQMHQARMRRIGMSWGGTEELFWFYLAEREDEIIV